MITRPYVAGVDSSTQSCKVVGFGTLLRPGCKMRSALTRRAPRWIPRLRQALSRQREAAGGSDARALERRRPAARNGRPDERSGDPTGVAVERHYAQCGCGP